MGYENYLKIKEWLRKRVRDTVEAIKEVYPEVEVYLVGSVAEGTFTANSDIDLLLIFPERPKARYRLPIYEAFFKRGLLPDYPIQLHLGDRKKLEEYKRLGKVIRLDAADRESKGGSEGG